MGREGALADEIRPLEDKRGAALQAGTTGKARASLSKILDAPSMWER